MQEPEPDDDWSDNQSHLFLSLPPEIREPIWASLDPKDCKALRLVCALFKWDVEQVLGVRAVLQQNEGTNEGEAQVLQWLKTVIVRSLEIQYVGRVMDSAEIRLKNPFMLLELVLSIQTEEFGDPITAQDLNRTLNSFPALSRLHISVQINLAPNVLPFEEILSEALTCLESKRQLKHFKFSTSYIFHTVEGEGYQIQPDPTYRPNIQFPTQLGTISLQAPLPSRKQHLGWLALLNLQTQLTKLELVVGKVSWHFFEAALRNSGSTLREVLLKMATPVTLVRTDEDFRCHFEPFWITYGSARDVDEGGGNLPDQEGAGNPSFDWSILARTTCLHTLGLGIHVSRFRMGQAIPSYNLSTVQLSSLRNLEVSHVHLTVEDLTWILIQWTNLTSVRISWFNLLAEQRSPAFRLEQKIRISILISIALQAKRYHTFEILEFSLHDVPYPYHSSIKSITAAVTEVVAPYNNIIYGGFSIVKV